LEYIHGHLFTGGVFPYVAVFNIKCNALFDINA